MRMFVLVIRHGERGPRARFRSGSVMDVVVVLLMVRHAVSERCARRRETGRAQKYSGEHPVDEGTSHQRNVSGRVMRREAASRLGQHARRAAG